MNKNDNKNLIKKNSQDFCNSEVKIHYAHCILDDAAFCEFPKKSTCTGI